MLFSDVYDVDRSDAGDWFDPILTVDTKLFVDPFRIFLDGNPQWQDAHQQLMGHFDRAFQQLANAGCVPGTLGYDGALALLNFPEPREFCLGYTSKGTRGSGGAGGYARLTAAAMCDAIRRGVEHLDHFEKVGIFREGIGPDRVSDITCTVLKPTFVTYTQDVAARHNIPLVRHRLAAAGFDTRRVARAQTAEVDLPTNPATGGPVLLVPERFLRELPALNAHDWFWSDEAAEVRRELSTEVLANVSKDDIVELARRNWDLVGEWTQRKEREGAPAYDLAADPSGLYRWFRETSEFANANPIELEQAEDDAAFARVIDDVIVQFKHYVEQRAGWRLLWNDDGTEKYEEAAQLLFQGLVSAYCAMHNINLDREVELGRGPVDFKFSNGYRHRAVLELKKLHSGSFWNGLAAQLPSYMTSDQCTDGWFLALQYRTGGISKTRKAELPIELPRVAKRHGFNLRYDLVDARRKKSASKLKPTRDR